MPKLAVTKLNLWQDFQALLTDMNNVVRYAYIVRALDNMVYYSVSASGEEEIDFKAITTDFFNAYKFITPSDYEKAFNDFIARTANFFNDYSFMVTPTSNLHLALHYTLDKPNKLHLIAPDC